MYLDVSVDANIINDKNRENKHYENIISQKEKVVTTKYGGKSYNLLSFVILLQVEIVKSS